MKILRKTIEDIVFVVFFSPLYDIKNNRRKKLSELLIGIPLTYPLTTQSSTSNICKANTVLSFQTILWSLFRKWGAWHSEIRITATLEELNWTSEQHLIPCFRHVVTSWTYAWFVIKTIFGSSLPPVVCMKAYVLYYLCLFANSGFQHILFCMFLVCLCPVYPMLPVSLDWPLLIALSVFSDVYAHFTKPSNRNVCSYIIYDFTIHWKNTNIMS